MERKDGAARAFIDFVESSDLETAQNAFIQCCNEVGMDTQGTIDTFYVNFKEAIKVLYLNTLMAYPLFGLSLFS